MNDYLKLRFLASFSVRDVDINQEIVMVMMVASSFKITGVPEKGNWVTQWPLQMLSAALLVLAMWRHIAKSLSLSDPHLPVNMAPGSHPVNFYWTLALSCVKPSGTSFDLEACPVSSNYEKEKHVVVRLPVMWQNFPVLYPNLETFTPPTLSQGVLSGCPMGPSGAQQKA